MIVSCISSRESRTSSGSQYKTPVSKEAGVCLSSFLFSDGRVPARMFSGPDSRWHDKTKGPCICCMGPSSCCFNQSYQSPDHARPVILPSLTSTGRNLRQAGHAHDRTRRHDDEACARIEDEALDRQREALRSAEELGIVRTERGLGDADREAVGRGPAAEILGGRSQFDGGGAMDEDAPAIFSTFSMTGASASYVKLSGCTSSPQEGPLQPRRPRREPQALRSEHRGLHQPLPHGP